MFDRTLSIVDEIGAARGGGPRSRDPPRARVSRKKLSVINRKITKKNREIIYCWATINIYSHKCGIRYLPYNYL